MTPLSTFGGGGGWLAPGSGYAYLGTANNERGLAFGNNHLYLVSRANVSGNANNIRILDPATGTDLGGLSSTGISGGTFPVNTVGVGGDGSIYVADLTTQSTTTPFKIYRWATEASTPTVVYSGDAGLAGSRVGDDLAVYGGSGTKIAAGYGSSPSVAGNNSYSIIDPVASSATAVPFTGTPPNAGDFRLGITFIDQTHVAGAQGSSLYRYTATDGTLIASPAIPDPSGATADRLLAYVQINGVSLLAVQSIGDSHVSLYDVSNPAAPLYLAAGNTTIGVLTANGNGTGAIAWDITGPNTANLYAMSTNQGIQAFTVTVPEPASVTLLALTISGALFRRPNRQTTAA